MRMGIDLKNFSVGPIESIYYIPSYISPSEQEYLIRQVNNAPASKWTTLKNRRLQNWGGKVHEKGLIAQSLPPWLASLTQRIWSQIGLFPSPINHVLVNEYTPGQGIMPHQDGPLYFPTVAIVSLGTPVVMKFFRHRGTLELRRSELDSPCDEDPQVGRIAKREHLSKDMKLTSGENNGTKKQKRDEQSVTECKQTGKPEFVAVVLQPGSLLIFKDAAYCEYLHGIEETVEHKLDNMVVNANLVMKDAKDCCEILSSNECGATHVLQRMGTRLSLTCRLVSKVQGKFLRL